MADTDTLARECFGAFSEAEISALQLVYIHNRAFHHWRMGALDEAERLLEQILLRNDVGAIPWKAKASILAALTATHRAAFQQAVWHLKQAEKIANQCEEPWRIYARARLIQARRGAATVRGSRQFFITLSTGREKKAITS